MPSGQFFHVLLIPRDTSALPVAFESAVETLEAMPNVHAEWDGSFVWRTPSGGQIDGMIYDAASRIRHVDLKGKCGLQEWLFLCDLFSVRAQPDSRATVSSDTDDHANGHLDHSGHASRGDDKAFLHASDDASAGLADLAVQVLSSPDRPVMSLPDFQAAFLIEDVL